MRFTVNGAGLAGTEAAWQIANAGHPVTRLHDPGPRRSREPLVEGVACQFVSGYRTDERSDLRVLQSENAHDDIAFLR